MRSSLLFPRMSTLRSTLLIVVGLTVCCVLAHGGDVDEAPAGLSTADWSGIRSAYEANRHAARAVENGFEAENPSQCWVTRFDGRGFSIRPHSGEWTWGLALQRYGFRGEEHDVREPVHVRAQGGRVAYEWDANVREWWQNDTSGLEHGYTVEQRPSQCDPGPLTFTLAMRGELRALVQCDGRSVQIANADGRNVLSYAGLFVLDADRHAVPARFELEDARTLRICIDESDARYPLTIDPIAQQAYLKASNTGASDRFGWSVAVSGDTVVVGAPRESSNANGVNGNQNDNSFGEAGAAYVFTRNGTSWSQQAYLKASNTDLADHFGFAVSVSGDTIVVGAIDESSNSTGVNGSQANNSAASSGAVYVFVRNGTTWAQQAYLKASNTGVADRFGQALSVSGDTLVVGAFGESSNAVGVNGNEADNSATNAGAAYVFVRSGTAWTQQAYLKASNTGAQDWFGFSVSVSDNTAVIGALMEDSDATGVNGTGLDLATDSGAAYVFTRSGTTWSQQAYLKASNTGNGDVFGSAVSVHGDTLVVGAHQESSSATGVNGDQSDNSAVLSGAAYVFVRTGTIWSQQAYLKASNTESVDRFGQSVSVSVDTIVVGAGAEDSNATGVNGNGTDNSFQSAGAAYVFVRNGTAWSQHAYLKASNAGAGDQFGLSVSVSGATIVVGAYADDSSATGVSGNQADNSASDSGGTYVFQLNSPTSFCFGDGLGTVCPCGNNGAAGKGCANSGFPGGAQLSASGYSGISTGTDTLVLTASDVPGPGLFFQGTAQFAGGFGILFGDGLLCAGGVITRMGVVFPTGTSASYPGGLTPNPIHIAGATTSGDVRHYQCWYRDSSTFCAAETSNLTQGLTVLWGP
jgi:hypothetical protein